MPARTAKTKAQRPSWAYLLDVRDRCEEIAADSQAALEQPELHTAATNIYRELDFRYAPQLAEARKASGR